VTNKEPITLNSINIDEMPFARRSRYDSKKDRKNIISKVFCEE